MAASRTRTLLLQHDHIAMRRRQPRSIWIRRDYLPAALRSKADAIGHILWFLPPAVRSERPVWIVPACAVVFVPAIDTRMRNAAPLEILEGRPPCRVPGKIVARPEYTDRRIGGENDGDEHRGPSRQRPLADCGEDSHDRQH